MSGRGQQRPSAAVPDEDDGLAVGASDYYLSLAPVIGWSGRGRARQVGNGYHVSGCGQFPCDWLPDPAPDQRTVHQQQQQPSLHALIRTTDAAAATVRPRAHKEP
jgi:hypothetical protein